MHAVTSYSPDFCTSLTRTLHLRFHPSTLLTALNLSIRGYGVGAEPTRGLHPGQVASSSPLWSATTPLLSTIFVAVGVSEELQRHHQLQQLLR